MATTRRQFLRLTGGALAVAGIDAASAVAQTGPVHQGDGVLEGADSGDDEAVGTANFLGLGDDVGGVAVAFKGFLNAAEVGHVR